jgi:hypothetical protein
MGTKLEPPYNLARLVSQVAVSANEVCLRGSRGARLLRALLPFLVTALLALSPFTLHSERAASSFVADQLTRTLPVFLDRPTAKFRTQSRSKFNSLTKVAENDRRASVLSGSSPASPLSNCFQFHLDTYY